MTPYVREVFCADFCVRHRSPQPNPWTLGAEELIAIHRAKPAGGQKLAPHIAALATGMRKFL
jgi:hypothetical protein